MPGVNLTNRLVDLLRAPIESGQWPPGHRLPSEHVLMDEHQLSSSTVRKAIELLRYAGLVVTYHGKGTFVAKRDRAYRIDITWPEPGRQSVSFLPGPSAHLDRRCIPQRHIAVSKDLARQLPLEVDADMVERTIQVCESGRPIVTTMSYVPPELTNGTDVWEDTTFACDLALPGHTAVSRCVDEQSRLPTPKEAKDLQLSTGSPVIVLARPYDVLVGDRSLPAGVIIVARGDKVRLRHWAGVAEGPGATP